MTSDCEKNKQMCKQYEEFMETGGRSMHDPMNAILISKFLIQYHADRYLQLSRTQYLEKFDLIVRAVHRTTERTPPQKLYASTTWPQYDKVDSWVKTAELDDEITLHPWSSNQKKEVSTETTAHDGNVNVHMCMVFKMAVDSDGVAEPNAKYISEFLNSWYAAGYRLLSQEEHDTQFDLLLRRTWNVMDPSPVQTYNYTDWLQLVNMKIDIQSRRVEKDSKKIDYPGDWFGFPYQDAEDEQDG